MAQIPVNGQNFPAEMHLVHKNGDALAVVGIMIEIGAETPVLSEIWEYLPSAAGASQTFAEVEIDPMQLLPEENRTTYRYTGSLTTPPCSEDVNWNLFTTPITMTSEQITAFEEVIGFHNNCPTQPLNGRIIQEDASID